MTDDEFKAKSPEYRLGHADGMAAANAMWAEAVANPVRLAALAAIAKSYDRVTLGEREG